jgi:signal transduction histidine kinase
MLDELARWLFDSSGLTPHGICLLWDPELIWLHAVSDAAIGFAYFTIPLALAVIVHRRRDIVFRPIFVLFAAFVLLCGAGHWLDLLTLWVPAYRLEGLVKATTAAVSIMTAISLWVLLPQALLLPSPAQLQEANDALLERDRQAVELSRLNADLEEFAYIASHDLRAPLRAIGRLADWIREDIQDSAGPETLENLELMQQRTARLEMLIASLLSYARAGHAKAAIETVDVSELVEEIIGSIAPPPGFHVRFQSETSVILTQRPPLDHVLRNLISNAIKHHDCPEGEVVVSMTMKDGVAKFQVKDDGPGIAPEFQERIFTIFQTLQSRDDQETSGVGLSIVRKTVERAGGKVCVESSPPRRGSTFLFTWPATIPTAVTPAATKIAAKAV